jgi:hypothetical protein
MDAHAALRPTAQTLNSYQVKCEPAAEYTDTDTSWHASGAIAFIVFGDTFVQFQEVTIRQFPG